MQTLSNTHFRRHQRTGLYQQHHGHHSKVDTEDERYWCPDCDLKTGAQFRLNIHRKKRGPLLAHFTCPDCGLNWTSAHSYCVNYQVPTHYATTTLEKHHG